MSIQYQSFWDRSYTEQLKKRMWDKLCFMDGSRVAPPVAFANCMELSAIAIAISPAKAAQAMVARSIKVTGESHCEYSWESSTTSSDGNNVGSHVF